MKKIIVVILLLSGIGFSFGININLSDIENYITNDKIILDEGINTIQKSNIVESNIVVSIDTGYNTLDKNYSNLDIIIECKNSYVKKINNDSITESIDSLTLTYDTDNTIKLICKPITNPAKLFENININYETINQKTTFSDPFSISKENIEITGTDIKENLMPNKKINNQPTFTDILFLQLKTIGNLTDSILIKKGNDFDFNSLFTSNEKYKQYEKWINKFNNFYKKEQFENAFSGSINMKDVAIAEDIINGLYKCNNQNICNQVIDFKNPEDKYDLYNLNYIENNLYSGNNSILSESINYYKSIQNSCSGENISDDYLKNQVNNLCTFIVKNNVDNISENTLYNLGYVLGQRIKNLENIKNNIGSGGINLLGIYNIYWEINNLALGSSKIEIVKKINNETDTEQQYNLFKKILLKEKDEIKDNKTDNTVKENTIIDTKINLFTSGTALYEEAKNKNINLFNPDIYSINNQIVQISGLNISSNEGSITPKDLTIDNLTLEGNGWSFNNLKVRFYSGTYYKNYNYKKVIFGNIVDSWYTKNGIYIYENDKNKIKDDFNNCYNNNLEIIKTAFGNTIHILNLRKYIKCTKSSLKQYDRIEIYSKLEKVDKGLLWKSYKLKYYGKYLPKEN